jgi:hypothetical protein
MRPADPGAEWRLRIVGRLGLLADFAQHGTEVEDFGLQFQRVLVFRRADTLAVIPQAPEHGSLVSLHLRVPRGYGGEQAGDVGAGVGDKSKGCINDLGGPVFAGDPRQLAHPRQP